MTRKRDSSRVGAGISSRAESRLRAWGGLGVDAVLEQVGVALDRIGLKVHVEPNLYRFSPLRGMISGFFRALVLVY